MTEWRKIPGFPGYEVSESGRVRRVVVGGRGHRPAEMHGWINDCGPNGGYLRVCLRREGESFHRYVHHLVCEVFHGEPPEPVGCAVDSYQVNHKDGNKLNNVAANLEWLTRGQNNTHAALAGLYRRGAANGRSKLTEEQVRDIRKELLRGAVQSEIADRFGVTRANVTAIHTGKSWSWLR